MRLQPRCPCRATVTAGLGSSVASSAFVCPPGRARARESLCAHLFPHTGTLEIFHRGCQYFQPASLCGKDLPHLHALHQPCYWISFVVIVTKQVWNEIWMSQPASPSLVFHDMWVREHLLSGCLVVFSISSRQDESCCCCCLMPDHQLHNQVCSGYPPPHPGGVAIYVCDAYVLRSGCYSHPFSQDQITLKAHCVFPVWADAAPWQ